MNVTNLNDWRTFVHDFLNRHTDRKFAFRGQTKNYPFVPSMRRALENFEHVDVPLTTFQWEVLIWRALQEVGVEKKFSEDKYRLIGMALLQAYGYRSWFIDVTKTPEIALWFALNKHSKETTRILKQENPEFHPCLHVPTSYYEQTDLSEGYFYIIDVTDCEDILFDLTRYVPKKALRVHAQNAAAIFEPDDRPIDDSIVVEIKLTGDVLKYGFTQEFTYDTLFPSLKEDSFYRYLLTLPYFVPTGHLQKHMAPAFPVVSVPFYRHNVKEVLDLGLRINVLTVPSFFPVENGKIGGVRFDTVPACVVKTKQFKFIDALQILIPQYPSKRPFYQFQIPEVESPTEPSTYGSKEEENSGSLHPNLSIWPTNNLLIIFALSPLYLPLGEFSHEFLPKGLWIVFDDNEMYVARFGFEDLSFVAEAGMHFRKDVDKYQIAKQKDDCSCGDFDCHMRHLNFFLFISHLIDTGRWRISQSCMGHRHLIQKI